MVLRLLRHRVGNNRIRFSRPDLVDHINTFLPTEGAPIPAIADFFTDVDREPRDLPKEFPMMSRRMQKGWQKRQQNCDPGG
jgi:hypothetical protein